MPENQEQIKQFIIITKEDGKKVVIADVLCDQSMPGASDILMWIPYDDILKTLALKVYHRMAGILERIYPSTL